MRSLRLSLVASIVSMIALGCHSHADAIDAGPAAVASADVGAAKKPPALKTPHPAVPSLPDLPPITAHAAPAVAPANTDTGEHPCRAVWTGTQIAPLACAQALFFGASPGAGAQPIVPRKLLSRDVASLPALVDHRIDGTEGPARDQGSTPACTAFATATAIDHAMLRWGGTQAPVSVMQIWSRYHSPHVETSLASNIGLTLGPEKAWPFSATEASSWIPCSEFPKPPRIGCDKPVDAAHVQKLAASAVGELTEIEYMATPPETSALQAKLAAGQDVVLAMELPPAFVPKGKAGARYIPHYTKSGGADAGHAVVLSGYVHYAHGTYFLAHNSWGTSWGDAGYAWIHEQTVALWARQVVAIDAEPANRTDASRAIRARGETTCDGALVQDSIRGTCAAACPDGSPRHDGVCPVAGQCPLSYVNLTGACVLAAPVSSGHDPDTGVAWTCGPGGCAYVLPRAIDTACSGSICKASCPAPDYRIAKMNGSIVCVE